MTEDYEPARVHITGSDISLSGHPAPHGYRAEYETFVLTSADGAQCILPQDEDREIAYVQPLDNDIIIGPSRGVVAAAVNTAAGVPNPNGSYIPKSSTVPYPVRDNGPVYAGITTTASNSRVSVTACYRVRQ